MAAIHPAQWVALAMSHQLVQLALPRLCSCMGARGSRPFSSGSLTKRCVETGNCRIRSRISRRTAMGRNVVFRTRDQNPLRCALPARHTRILGPPIFNPAPQFVVLLSGGGWGGKGGGGEKIRVETPSSAIDQSHSNRQKPILSAPSSAIACPALGRGTHHQPTFLRYSECGRNGIAHASWSHRWRVFEKLRLLYAP